MTSRLAPKPVRLKFVYKDHDFVFVFTLCRIKKHNFRHVLTPSIQSLGTFQATFQANPTLAVSPRVCIDEDGPRYICNLLPSAAYLYSGRWPQAPLSEISRTRLKKSVSTEFPVSFLEGYHRFIGKVANRPLRRFFSKNKTERTVRIH